MTIEVRVPLYVPGSNEFGVDGGVPPRPTLTLTPVPTSMIRVGDVVMWTEPVRGWRRFKLWLRRPWRHAPRTVERRSIIRSVTSSQTELQ